MSQQEVLKTLALFRQNRQEEFGIVRIGLFGSTARETASDESDVDVVVELSQPDLFHLIGIKQELEALFNRPVDIVRYRERMNRFLKQRIDEEAIYV
jgi:predicted nucleotidyltransferase